MLLTAAAGTAKIPTTNITAISRATSLFAFIKKASFLFSSRKQDSLLWFTSRAQNVQGRTEAEAFEPAEPDPQTQVSAPFEQ